MEIWNKIEPCLVRLRLKGPRKVMEEKMRRRVKTRGSEENLATEPKMMVE